MQLKKLSEKIYYKTNSLCPYCEKIIPGEVMAKNGGVFVVRNCPQHGLIEGLACSDIEWFENLKKFDVEPAKPLFHLKSTDKGCPQDCGLCPSHRQSAGTAAIEISNKCNSTCPVCLADNQGTFEMGVEEVKKIADDFLAKQKMVDAFTLSGGEPTIHPQILDIIRALNRPEILRIVLNTNGLRMAQDDKFLDDLAECPKVYVCIHHDGPAATQIRGTDFSVQEKALNRLLKWNINVAPLILAVKDINDRDLGKTVTNLLTKSPAIKSVFISIMAYSGRRGSRFKIDPQTRLTIPAALSCIASSSNNIIKKSDFMPLPMPNPICAAIGYFLVMDNEITPLISLMDIDRVIHHTKNAHFARAEGELETLLKDTINDIYAHPSKFPEPQKLLGKFKKLLMELFPEGKALALEERRRLAEERIKTVYLMQFMDSWTFDSVRLSKCSCQHLLPHSTIIPSCGYYAYHRRFDRRFTP